MKGYAAIGVRNRALGIANIRHALTLISSMDGAPLARWRSRFIALRC